MRMDRLKIALPLLATIMVLAGCYDYAERPRGAEAHSRVPLARVTGPDETCIPLTRFNQTEVRDGRTIDFLSSSNRGWRNVLPDSCPGLASERAFSFATSLTQLCSTDIIHVLYHAGSGLQPGAACGIGRFTPIELGR